MKKHLFVALLLVCGVALADDSVRSITTAGTASISFVPDRAYIPIKISIEAPKFVEAEATVSEVRAKLTEALKLVGISKNDIASDSRVLQNHYERRNDGKVVVIGQTCIDSSTILVRDLKLVNEVVRVLAEVENVYNEEPTYVSDKQGEAKREALLKAAEMAKEKAELLAKQAGVKIKGVLQIGEDNGWTSSGWTSKEANMQGSGANFSGYSSQNGVSNNAITVTVHARYLIE
ncbi:MAG: SIMPL domain-containing protein [Opitutaceae bacterium]|nr:SIMPL domain-containing protein [Opitutaceae bacterium]